MSWNKKK